MTKTQDGSKRLFTLNDAQIATHRPLSVEDGPNVATQIQSGTCRTRSQCEDAGGLWEQGIFGGNCIDARHNCKDKGSGDWD